LKVTVERGRQLDQVLSRKSNDLQSQTISPQGCCLKSKCPETLGTHVYLWWIHFDIWQNQYNIVKLKNKIKEKEKKMYVVGVCLKKVYKALIRLAREAFSVPLLMSMSEAFSVAFLTLIKLCYTKALE